MSRLIEDVARGTHVTLVPLRQHAVEYELNYNTKTKTGIGWGILTVDSVHPCQTIADDVVPCPPHTHGNYLIANAMAEGLIKATKSRTS